MSLIVTVIRIHKTNPHRFFHGKRSAHQNDIPSRVQLIRNRRKFLQRRRNPVGGGGGGGHSRQIQVWSSNCSSHVLYDGGYLIYEIEIDNKSMVYLLYFHCCIVKYPLHCIVEIKQIYLNYWYIVIDDYLLKHSDVVVHM